MLNTSVKEYLDDLDQGPKVSESSIGEHSIAGKIKNILEKEKEYESTKEDSAEQAAFDFMEDYMDSDSGWGTYYGPVYVLPNDKGEMREYPSIQKVDQEILEYWTKRSKESKNPILQSRYADLVVDFSQKVLDRNAEIELFWIVIDSNIIICEKLLAEPVDCVTKIGRALRLSIQINDKERINKTKNIAIKLEKDIAIDSTPGLWRPIFQWLLLDKEAKKITFEDKEKTELINRLEERLKRVGRDTWLTEKAVFLLAEYYANRKDEKNLMRVLGVFENSFKTNERFNSDALLKSHAYEQIHEVYRKYAGDFPEAQKANKRLSQEIGQLDLDWNKSLKEISVETKIKNEDIDKYLRLIFGENKDDKLEMVMQKIAIRHLPRKNTIKEQLDETFSKHPLQFICPQKNISDDGILIAKLSGLDKDYDNRFQVYASEYIQSDSIFLSHTLHELRQQFSKEEILEYCEGSVAFENGDNEYLKRAISAYWDEDYLVSSHLFIPLIESGIRELVRIRGGSFLTLNDLNGYDVIPLSTLLKKNAPILENIFGKNNHNILFYFRLVLTEKLGMNLRNDFAHGLGMKTKKFLGRNASDRLFHILICLSLVRWET